MTRRINLWSSPRNISTALMYSFAQRSDCQVIDEPLYAHYLSQLDAPERHPAYREVLKSQNNNGLMVLEYLKTFKTKQPVLLSKQMTHHLLGLNFEDILGMQHILLIRDPRYIIQSYSKVIANPTMQDIGIERQLELYAFLKRKGERTSIIDTHELLKAPKKVLKTLCAQQGIPFEDQMLHWPSGAKREDGIWAKHWYSNVHQSTGFKKYEAKAIQLDLQQEELATTCMPFYNKLFLEAIKA